MTTPTSPTRSPDPRRSVARLAGYSVAALLLSGALLELALQGLAVASPAVAGVLSPASRDDPRRVPDPLLGARPNPDWGDHDSAGFRNAQHPEHARVVVLGDSQTYGTGVARHETWPSQLARSTGSTVYNMASPGHGAVHALALLDEALALDPELVVATVYAGNDLYDAFQLVHADGLGPEVAPAAPGTLEALQARQAQGALRDEVEALYHGRKEVELGALRGALSRHSKLYGLLRATKRVARGPVLAAAPSWEGQLAAARARPHLLEPFEGAGARTLFTPAYRRLALQLADPRIREGLRLTLDALRRLHERAVSAGVRFAVVAIPTKELVFSPAVLASGGASETYAELVALEQRLWNETFTFLRAEGIETVEALPGLRRALDTGAQPYPIDHDGHPTAAGQAAIANCVAEELRLTD